MMDFRDDTSKRFDSIYRRLNGLERSLNEFKDDIRIQMGAWRDQLRADFLVGIEYLKDIAAGKKDTSDPVNF